MASERYPKQGAMFGSQLEALYPRFAELREDFLLDYGYNTARAYWSDLDDLLWWAHERGKDPLQLTREDIRKYLALLKRRGYSPSTIRRRVTTWRAFYAYLVAVEERARSPVEGMRVRRQRKP